MGIQTNMLSITFFLTVASAMPQLAIRSDAPSPYSSDAQAPYNDWRPAYVDEFRGPCPMLNTLANHGFLPHDGGKDGGLTLDRVIRGLSFLNFNESLATVMFEQALVANPEPNSTFFNLDMLNVHGVLEHDASLSRSDHHFGNNHVFNQSIFDQSKKYWTTDILDRYQMSNAKLARQIQSRASNPEYSFSSSVENFSIGEILAPFIVFGDRDAVTVDRAWVEFFFENERLPTSLGWTPQERVVNLEDITGLMGVFFNATSLITGAPAAAGAHKRRDFHAALST